MNSRSVEEQGQHILPDIDYTCIPIVTNHNVFCSLICLQVPCCNGLLASTAMAAAAWQMISLATADQQETLERLLHDSCWYRCQSHSRWNLDCTSLVVGALPSICQSQVVAAPWVIFTLKRMLDKRPVVQDRFFVACLSCHQTATNCNAIRMHGVLRNALHGSSIGMY